MTTASPSQAFDLDEFEDIGTTTLVLKNPATGAPGLATIELIGPEHPVRKKIAMDRARKMRAEFQRNGKITVTDPLDDIEEETDYLVACTQGWANVTVAGAPLAYSPAAALALYTDPKRQWLRAQVKKALDEAERFISDSAKT